MVSPSPAIESSCNDPTFVKFESPRSSVPVTVKFPVMSVLAFNFIAPVPLGSSVKSALLGTDIVEPTIVRSPSDRSANASVPLPSVLRNCPTVPSEVGYANPDSVACPDVFRVPSTTTPSLMLIVEESAELKVVPRIVIASSTMFPVPDVVNVRSAFVGAIKFVIEISPSDPNSRPLAAAFTFNICPAVPIAERPVPPCAVPTVSPDCISPIPVATFEESKTTLNGVLSAIIQFCAPLSCSHGMHSFPLYCRYLLLELE